jgi:hypothetical protein
MIWHRPSKRIWRGRRAPNLLICLLDRFADPGDYQASDALSRVQQAWGYDHPRSAGRSLPVLLENRIEVLCQVASLVAEVIAMRGLRSISPIVRLCRFSVINRDTEMKRPRTRECAFTFSRRVSA